MFSPRTVVALTVKVTLLVGSSGPEAQVLVTVRPVAGHAGGSRPARRSNAVNADAYDHVKSLALSGEPFWRVNCSARDPSAGVYFWLMAMKPSA